MGNLAVLVRQNLVLLSSKDERDVNPEICSDHDPCLRLLFDRQAISHLVVPTIVHAEAIHQHLCFFLDFDLHGGGQSGNK